MNLELLWAEIEAEKTWRIDEIRFFRNQGMLVNSENKQDQFRRAITLLLYAHFEGFCKYAFTLYVNAVNKEEISCGEANFAIAAISLSDLFKALRDPNSKCAEFKNSLPDDNKLHIFARDREFIERNQSFESRTVNIPDEVIDTESNLKPVVLRKLLFRLGFRHDEFESFEGSLSMLLNYRNKIAHGELKDGIKKETFDDLQYSTFRIMNDLKSNLMKSLSEKRYLRQSV